MGRTIKYSLIKYWDNDLASYMYKLRGPTLNILDAYRLETLAKGNLAWAKRHAKYYKIKLPT